VPKFLIEIEDLVKKENVDDVYMRTPDPGCKVVDRQSVNTRRLKRILNAAKDPISGFQVGKFKIIRLKG
jgi:hypothetical protein